MPGVATVQSLLQVRDLALRHARHGRVHAPADAMVARQQLEQRLTIQSLELAFDKDCTGVVRLLSRLKTRARARALACTSQRAAAAQGNKKKATARVCYLEIMSRQRAALGGCVFIIHGVQEYKSPMPHTTCFKQIVRFF